MTFADFFRVLLPSKVIWDADFDSDIHFALRRLEMTSWNHQVIKVQWRHMTRKWFFEFWTPKNYPWAFKNHRNVFYSSQGTRWMSKFCSNSIISKVISDHGFLAFFGTWPDLRGQVKAWNGLCRRGLKNSVVTLSHHTAQFVIVGQPRGHVFYSSQGTRWMSKFCSNSIISKVISDHGFRHFSALDLTSEVRSRPEMACAGEG